MTPIFSFHVFTKVKEVHNVNMVCQFFLFARKSFFDEAMKTAPGEWRTKLSTLGQMIYGFGSLLCMFMCHIYISKTCFYIYIFLLFLILPLQTVVFG